MSSRTRKPDDSADLTPDERRRLDYLTDRGAKWYRRGTDCRWVSSLAASRIVGRYYRGATLGMAKKLKLSVSQVNNLARAGATYRALRRWAYGMAPVTEGLGHVRGWLRTIHSLRKELTYTHFAVLGELWARYEFSPVQAIDYLKECVEYSVSVSDMRAMIEAKHGEPDGSPLELDSNKMVAADAANARIDAALQRLTGRVVEISEQDGMTVYGVAVPGGDGTVGLGDVVMIHRVGG